MFGTRKDETDSLKDEIEMDIKFMLGEWRMADGTGHDIQVGARIG